MNYFELFSRTVQLKIGKQSLHKKFIGISKKYHLDYFATHHGEKQAEKPEISASLNKARKTLQDPDESIKYVFLLNELLTEEEKCQCRPGCLWK